jgi:EAL domain-containing protein (putative c-di-GMP-specific phosphodiesterase class I)
LRLAVNAPVAALAGDRLTPFVRDHRPRSAHWPGLTIEVSEGDLVSDIDSMMEAAAQLRIYDVELSVDDFGVGYSSFGRLKQLSFCEIKLDKSYVRNCASDRTNADICRSIVNLAHGFGAAAVAEGVECLEDRDMLLAMGCDFAQGYFLARPMSLPSLVDLAVRHPPGNGSGIAVRSDEQICA